MEIDMEKTNEELEREILEKNLLLKINDLAKQERKQSDDLYAIKLAQYAIFAVVGLICMTVIGYLIKSVLIQ